MVDERKRKIARVHTLVASHKMEDSAYREMLGRLTGKQSCRDLSEQELDSVLSELSGAEKQLPVEHSDIGGDLTRRQVYYIKGLWELCSRAKSIHALRALLRRQAGVEDLRFVPKDKASAVICCLQDIARKAGFNPYHAPKEVSHARTRS